MTKHVRDDLARDARDERQRCKVCRMSWQQHNAGTGAVHAAGWASRDGTLVLAREDVGRPAPAAISRPTGLAVRMAEAAGIGLAALVRGRSANLYAHPDVFGA